MLGTWAPSSRTFLYHCSDDETIYPSITSDTTSGALVVFLSKGSSAISKIDTATGGHGGCPYIFTPAICFAQLEAVGGSKANLDAAVAGGQFPLSYCD